MKKSKKKTNNEFSGRATVYADKTRGVWVLIIYQYDKEGKRIYGKNKFITTRIPIRLHSDGSPMQSGRTEAEQMLREYLKVHRSDGYAKVLFSDVSREWIDMMERRMLIRENTASSYRNQLGVLSNYFDENDICMNIIVPDDLEELKCYLKNRVNRQGNKITPNTLKKYCLLISQVFEYATQKGYLKSNPAEKLEIPKVKKKPVEKFFTTKEIKRIIKASENTDIAVPVYLCAKWGLRRSEACGLRWSDLDWEEQTAHIQNTIVYVDGKPTESVPKSDKSDRLIPFTDKQREYLKKIRAKQEEDKRYFKKSYAQNDYICRYPDGQLITPEQFYKKFVKILEELNMHEPGIGVHILRHSYATNYYLKSKNPNIKLLQYLLGHSRMETTSDTYVHADLGSIRKEVLNIEEIYEDESTENTKDEKCRRKKHSKKKTNENNMDIIG